MYFGQQNIQANSNVASDAQITDQNQIDAITYEVIPDPTAEAGT